MIEPICDFCGNKLTDFGGLLFSPPDEQNNVKKFHICKSCYTTLITGGRCSVFSFSRLANQGSDDKKLLNG